MFGKPRDTHDTDTLDTSALDEFFGDEAAAENSVEIHDLRDRVQQVESQISSQFTSLATYAQIAHEQIELARSESKAATERSEQRLTSLVERERADRITSYTGVAPEGSPDITSRLDALEHSVARIQKGLDDCRQQQKDLALAITTMFDRLTTASAPADNSEPDPGPAPFAPPSFAPPSFEAPSFSPPSFEAPSFEAPAAALASEAHDHVDGPISALALNG